MPRSKDRSIFVCEACGNESPKWEGRCGACGRWNSLVEMRPQAADGRRNPWHGLASEAQELAEVRVDDVPRLNLSSGEVNRVLGGGIVRGSLVLIAGDPGIGKSTLLLRLASDVASSIGQALYISGEESAAQIKMRAERLNVPGKDLFLLTATNVAEVLEQLERRKPALALVDSIQTMYDDSIASEAGSVVQIRECARQLMAWAKARDVPVILTGHVTKSGDIAGPRVLEHMVDVVLYMEGDPVSSYRLLRTVKNRFGSTNEVGVFEMTSRGLTDVEDPSRAFLSERRQEAVGSVVVATLEGSRPLLVEVQALATPSVLPQPRRVANGIDFNRLLLVCAVLGRRAGLHLANQDIVVNVTGGLRISEPAADLGLALAIASSVRNVPLGGNLAAIGEVGLTGEIRGVPQLERRVAEAQRLGLSQCLVPGKSGQKLVEQTGLEAIPVETLAQAVRARVPGNRQRQNAGQDTRAYQIGDHD